MINFGLVSYLTAALFFAIFSLLLVTSWKGRLQGGLLVASMLVCFLWSLAGGFAGNFEFVSLKNMLALEVARNVILCAFIWHALSYTRIQAGNHWFSTYAIGFFSLCVLTIAAVFIAPLSSLLNSILGVDFRIFSHVTQAVVGLVLVEQLFRNTRLELRWAIKFLCIGLGVIFAYDFVLFTEALLFGRLDENLWATRGIVNALVAPLIAVAVSRNPQWSVEIFVSRSIIFHTTGLLAMGVYLLAMAVVGFYIRDYGGSWGQVGQIIFVVAAMLVLVILMFSGRIRARIRVFFNRHFFTYKYDYRKEWLDLNRTISQGNSADDLRIACIRGLSDIVDSVGGVLWLKRGKRHYEAVAELSMHLESFQQVSIDNSLVQFLANTGWVIEVPEYLRTPELYEGLELTDWSETISDLWLIVPLFQRGELYGFIGLSSPRAPRDINWEDHDLLKTVGQQLASYIGLIDASDELANARQFEAYNRLSAFVVHDLKNLIAQISLVVRNAEKHRDNPEFIDDAMETLANSVDKMNRLMVQLRKGKLGGPQGKSIELKTALEKVIAQQSNAKPIPEMATHEDDLMVVTDMDRFVSVLGHMVQNAQDATESHGFVKLRLYKAENRAIIEIEDNGCGMDERFIRERLFRPFDTTKGNAGMGIGVYEARQYVEELGGKIEVQSEPNKGAKFYLALPLVEEEDEDESQ